MFRKILVPTDFSECSALALRQALAISAACDASLDVLHAYDIPTFVPPHVVVVMAGVEASISEHAEAQAKAQLQELVEACNAQEGVARRELRLGPAAGAVVEFVGENDYDLIVMGTHGRTGLSRLFLGSVAANVLRHSVCPVLAVTSAGADEAGKPPSESVHLPERILVPVEDWAAARAVLDQLALLPNARQLQLELQHVVEPLPFVPPEVNGANGTGLASYPEVAAKQARELLSQCSKHAVGLQLHVAATRICTGYVSDEILGEARSFDADWIAMATHQRKGVGRWFLGSVTERVVGEAKRPVLTVPRPKDA